MPSPRMAWNHVEFARQDLAPRGSQRRRGFAPTVVATVEQALRARAPRATISGRALRSDDCVRDALSGGSSHAGARVLLPFLGRLPRHRSDDSNIPREAIGAQRATGNCCPGCARPQCPLQRRDGRRRETPVHRCTRPSDVGIDVRIQHESMPFSERRPEVKPGRGKGRGWGPSSIRRREGVSQIHCSATRWITHAVIVTVLALLPACRWTLRESPRADAAVDAAVTDVAAVPDAPVSPRLPRCVGPGADALPDGSLGPLRAALVLRRPPPADIGRGACLGDLDGDGAEELVVLRADAFAEVYDPLALCLRATLASPPSRAPARSPTSTATAAPSSPSPTPSASGSASTSASRAARSTASRPATSSPTRPTARAGAGAGPRPGPSPKTGTSAASATCSPPPTSTATAGASSPWRARSPPPRRRGARSCGCGSSRPRAARASGRARARRSSTSSSTRSTPTTSSWSTSTTTPAPSSSPTSGATAAGCSPSTAAGASRPAPSPPSASPPTAPSPTSTATARSTTSPPPPPAATAASGPPPRSAGCAR
jgi:hypothetical protein